LLIWTSQASPLALDPHLLTRRTVVNQPIHQAESIFNAGAAATVRA
jgi:hypothetical protein